MLSYQLYCYLLKLSIIQYFKSIMGECQNRIGDRNQIPQIDISRLTKKQKQSPTKIVQQLRHFPPIPKVIDNVMRQLDRFNFTTLPPQLQTNLNQQQKKYKRFVQKVSQRKGIFKLNDKSIYEGTIQEGKFKGPGKLLFPGTAYILSTFINNKPCYNTRIIKISGEYFDGYIPNSEKNQPSKGEIFQRGLKYKGEILNKKPHGNGQQISDSHYYIGQYINGEKSNGKLRLFNETKRKSFIKESNASLSAVLTKTLQQISKEQFFSKKQEIYEGQFKKGCYNGFGILQDKKGKYQGHFKDGKKEGYGKIMYWDGSQFHGNFKNDQPITKNVSQQLQKTVNINQQ